MSPRRHSASRDQLSLFDAANDTPVPAPAAYRRVSAPPPPMAVAAAFRPCGNEDLAPAAPAAKLAANIAALEVLAALAAAKRAATPDEQRTLARWSGWGALPDVFADTACDGAETARVRALLGADRWEPARHSVLTAFYTDALVATAMWDALGALGFDGGIVLEPGCGSGTLIGFAPDHAVVTGVEADPTAAAIAHHLYGARATIHTATFETFDCATEHFDCVVGNVPFADIAPVDPTHNRDALTLHNYFIVKALRLTRPGGIAALLTSRYTLDARSPKARRAIAAVADLLGAVRLPVNAFVDIAGTETVADLLLLRRRGDDEAPSGPAWQHTLPVPGEHETPVHYNEYFAEHPAQVLGEISVARGMYGKDTVTVTERADQGDFADDLAGALARVVADATDRGALYLPRRTARPSPSPAPSPRRDVPIPATAEQGSFVADDNGMFYRLTNGSLEPYAPPRAGDRAELRRLIRLRDSALAVLAAQIDHADDAPLREAQAALTRCYDDYRRRHGFINRYRLVGTGKTDPDTGEETTRRLRPTMGGFRDDPHWPLVSALEDFDDDQQSAEPAALFHQRVIGRRSQRHHADTPADAIAICLDEYGRVTIERVAALLGVATAQAREALGTQVYDDPDTGQLVPAPHYLSGNVRVKLAAARAAAQSDPAYEVNVAALEAVLPPPLGPEAITAQLGAPWVDEADIETFCSEVLDVPVTVEHVASLGRWFLRASGVPRNGVALVSTWGTARADALTLLDDALNQRDTVIYDLLDDDTRVRNDAETLAAVQKREELNERFTTWVWEEQERARRIADRYNDLFNAVVPARHDGSHLTFPGLSAAFTPRPHQRDAVARILTDGRALVAHPVGAGKTAVFAMAAMELRRLGLASKPGLVVPGHILDQVVREWLHLYPAARLLVADSDKVTRAKRKEFVARCAAGDWDAVIFTQSSYARLALSKLQYRAYLEAELDELTDAIAVSRSGKGLSVKRLERRRSALQARIRRMLAEHGKDDGIRFDHCGIDYQFVDEAHHYKNLRIESSRRDMSRLGSQRAQDLDGKLFYLRRRRHDPRVATFTTATPITNSIAEMWVMQRLLQPDVLEAAGVTRFDPWAAAFARTATRLELAPDGASYRLNTRLARFHNLPELQSLFRQVADVRTATELELPAPRIAGGKPRVVVIPPTDELRAYVASLAERAEKIRARLVPPTEDNMLKVCTDGRLAALDPRLVGIDADPEASKLTAVADEVAAVYHNHSGDTYVDDSGRPAQRRGSLQLVFCDLSTPVPAQWHAYGELRRLLSARGVPEQTVRFIHDAARTEAKAALFAACRDGRVAVLVGSTEKMGTGTNVQRRCVAIHQVDCPWRPDGIQQRDGRGLRQGNANDEIELIRYVVEGSFDIYSWQTAEYKAIFIHEVLAGGITSREVDDIGDTALSYAEVKAAATGNPLILEKADVDTQVVQLARLARAHDDDQARLAITAEHAAAELARLDPLHSAVHAAIARRADTRGEKFRLTVAGTAYRDRASAGAALREVVAPVLAAAADRADAAHPPVTLGGLRLTFSGARLGTHLAVTIDDRVPLATYDADDWLAREPLHITASLERRIANLDRDFDDLTRRIDGLRRHHTQATQRLGAPFPHTDRLTALRRRQQELDAELAAADSAANLASDFDDQDTDTQAA